MEFGNQEHLNIGPVVEDKIRKDNKKISCQRSSDKWAVTEAD